MRHKKARMLFFSSGADIIKIKHLMTLQLEPIFRHVRRQKFCKRPKFSISNCQKSNTLTTSVEY